MPANLNTKSLKQFCLRKIALCFDSFWMKSFNEQFKDVPRILYVIGPFDHMTNETVQDLINSLIDVNRLKAVHFQLLLQESVVRLDLSKAPKPAVSDSVLKVIALRCPRLRYLDLSRSAVSPRSLSDLLKQLPELQHLDLSFTKCNDQMLSLLGHYCPKLHRLQLANTPVTDCGMFSLCQAPSAEIGCKKLVHIDILDTSVKQNGVAHCLYNLPNLHYLRHHNIIGAIQADMDMKIESGEDITPYKLRQITATGDVSNIRREVWSSFPNVVELSLIADFKAVDMTAIGSLKHLKVLTLEYKIFGSGAPDTGLTVSETVTQLFAKIGKQLEKLSLLAFFPRDFFPLRPYCTKLKELYIWYFEDDERLEGLQENRLCYGNLIKCEAYCGEFRNCCLKQTGLLAILKGAPNLETLSIDNLDEMENDELLEIYSVNPLKRIKNIRFKGCNDIDTDVLYPLLDGENDLQNLDLTGCNDISKRNIKDLLDFAKQNYLNISITWS